MLNHCQALAVGLAPSKVLIIETCCSRATGSSWKHFQYLDLDISGTSQNLQLFGTSIRALPSGSGSACPNRNHNLQWQKSTFPTSSSGTWQVIGFTKFQSCPFYHFKHPFTPLPQELFGTATSHTKPHLLHRAHQHALVGQNTTDFGILWGWTRLRSFQVNLIGKTWKNVGLFHVPIVRSCSIMFNLSHGTNVF